MRHGACAWRKEDDIDAGVIIGADWPRPVTAAEWITSSRGRQSFRHVLQTAVHRGDFAITYSQVKVVLRKVRSTFGKMAEDL
jgi:hypothetical protein